MKIFMQGQNQRASRKLQQINLTSTKWALETSYQDLCYLIKTQIKKPTNIVTYLQTMKKTQISSENMLKYCIFAHNYAQNSKIIITDCLNDFLAHLLCQAPILMEKYSKKQCTKDRSTSKRTFSKSPCRSHNQSPIVSTRSQQIFVCKEIYLITNIIRPYISYQMKLFSSHTQYSQIINKKKGVQKHQAWMFINYLKIICSITSSFITIGRYFITNYGHLIVLLIKTLIKDINQMMHSISKFVQDERTDIYNKKLFKLSYQQQADQLIQMLQEIAKINDQLFKVYYGKYFLKSLNEISQPKWINPNSKQFDELYKSRRGQTIEINNQTRKKRSLSTGISSTNHNAKKNQASLFKCKAL